MKIFNKTKISISAIAFIFFGIGFVFDQDLIAGILTDDGKFSNIVFQFYVDLMRFIIWGWGVLLVVATFVPRFRAFIVIIFCISIALGITEILSIFAYQSAYGKWHYTYPIHYDKIFRPHPRTVGEPVANVEIIFEGLRIAHNKFGFRGDQKSLKKPPGTVRIATLGGSSTYGVHVGNREVWANIMDEMSGPGVQVFNLGVTGYSSVEHVAQTAWKLPALDIDIAIFYFGWNDIRNIGISNLQGDYSGFHARTLYQGLGFPDYVITGAKYSALLALLDKVLQELGVLQDFHRQSNIVDFEGEFAEEIDKHTMDIFRANIRSIIGLAKAHNIVPVLAPQILNYERLTSASSSGWMPRLRDRDVKKFMAIYNEEMRSISKEMHVTFIEAPLNWNWSDNDFVDQGHFSVKGNRIFGKLILEALKTHGLLPK